MNLLYIFQMLPDQKLALDPEFDYSCQNPPKQMKRGL